jgi:hypothetical protein
MNNDVAGMIADPSGPAYARPSGWHHCHCLSTPSAGFPRGL